VSYCRWSSDDWRSDLYVYESDQGVEIHVASNRKPQAFFDALPPRVPCDPHDEAVFARWFERGQDVRALLDAYESEPIGLPHDGQSFTVDIEDAAGAVAALALIGYHVPDGVVDALCEATP